MVLGDGRKITAKEIIAILFSKEMLIPFCSYLLLIPIGVLICLAGRKLDRYFGFKKLPGKPWNIILWLLFTVPGFIIVWWSYLHLIIIGQGCSMGVVKKTKKLVKCGPYAVVRNPSIIGKLFGVLGLGFLLRSVSFTFILVPALLAGSLAEKKINEEKFLYRQFGEEYLQYKRQVPMFIPKIYPRRSS